jgi:hypothetical protein
MGLVQFVYIVFFGSIVALSLGFDTSVIGVSKKDQPLVMFEDATMYTMDKKQVTQIAKAQKAIRYKTKDELFDASFVMRVNNDTKTDQLDILSANKVIKKSANLYLRGDVKYNRSDIMQFESEFLNYNLNSKIAYNKHKFNAIYNGDKLTGTNLYVDAKKSLTRAKNTKFIVELEDKR